MARDDLFECSKCGACCRLVGLAHPEFDRGDLGCVFLRGGNRCLIYKRRPSFCNVHETWRRKYSGKLGWDEFRKANSAMCAKARAVVEAMDSAGVDTESGR